jgi:hypothetical protein
MDRLRLLAVLELRLVQQGGGLKLPSIKLNERISAEIVDPDDILPVYADVVTEIRMFEGVFHLSLASVVVEGFNDDAVHTARVCARLRIANPALQAIKNLLATPRETPPPPGQAIN